MRDEMLSLTAVVAAALTPSDRGPRAGGEGDAGDSAGMPESEPDAHNTGHRHPVDSTLGQPRVPNRPRRRDCPGDVATMSDNQASATTADVSRPWRTGDQGDERPSPADRAIIDPLRSTP